MRFGKFDVTEGQVCVIILMLASSIFGPQIWDYDITVSTIELIV